MGLNLPLPMYWSSMADEGAPIKAPPDPGVVFGLEVCSSRARLGAPPAASNLLRSVDAAIAPQVLLAPQALQFTPESEDEWVTPGDSSATNLTPSLEETTEIQFLTLSRAVQLTPASVDV